MRDQPTDTPPSTQLLLLPDEAAEEQRMLDLVTALQDPETMHNTRQLIALQQENTRRRAANQHGYTNSQA